MQVLVCKKPHHLELAHADKPKCLPGHAVVRIRRIGICGTDIHACGGNLLTGHLLRAYPPKCPRGVIRLIRLSRP